MHKYEAEPVRRLVVPPALDDLRGDVLGGPTDAERQLVPVEANFRQPKIS